MTLLNVDIIECMIKELWKSNGCIRLINIVKIKCLYKIDIIESLIKPSWKLNASRFMPCKNRTVRTKNVFEAPTPKTYDMTGCAQRIIENISCTRWHENWQRSDVSGRCPGLVEQPGQGGQVIVLKTCWQNLTSEEWGVINPEMIE